MSVPTIDPFGGLEGEDRDAYAATLGILRAYGLESLAPTVLGFITQGYSSDTIQVLLPETPEYKQRFQANEARRKAGLPVLSPAEYLSVEDSYRQIMSSAGLPIGFYDQPSDFTSWIAQDVAPQEVQQRVATAKEIVNNLDPGALGYMRQWYTDGDLVAYALDRTRAADVLERQWKASQAASAGRDNGLRLNQGQAEQVGNLGLSDIQMRAGMSEAANLGTSAQRLSTVYGGQFTEQDAIDATFFSSQPAQQRARKLASQERASFSGSSGVTSKSLSAKTAGQL